MAGSGEPVGLLHDGNAREDVPIVLQLPRAERASLDTLKAIRLQGPAPIAVGELTRAVESVEASSIYHKNLRPVTYITGDVAGGRGEPRLRHPRDEQGAVEPEVAGGLSIRNLQRQTPKRQRSVRR